MRVIQNPQKTLGEVSIENIVFNPKSRDDIDQLLQGLQAIYCDIETRSKLFDRIAKLVPDNVDANTGRPGMELWRVFVLGMLRLNLDWDFDRLVNMVNNHSLIRKMLGHSDWFNGDFPYEVQTVKDNFALLTPEVTNEINLIIVNFGHSLLNKKELNDDGNITLKTRGDSFVVETDVHYPTDINLLYDAMKKSIELVGQLFTELELSDWRQYKHQVNLVKKSFLRAQNAKRTKGDAADEKIKSTHKDYIKMADKLLQRLEQSLVDLSSSKPSNTNIQAKIASIEVFTTHAKRQIDQIQRRVLQGEVIPHEEKVLSIFQPHTEWISKGKAGVPVEFGVKVGIIEDQYQFILHHRVMYQESDAEVAVPMAAAAKAKFLGMNAISYDKGFYSSDNRDELNDVLEHVSLPKKGKLSKKDKAIQTGESYLYATEKHSAVESAINALEIHGLDKCPDHGVTGFSRYVAVAVASRNLQRVGAIVHQRKQSTFIKRERKKRFLKAA